MQKKLSIGIILLSILQGILCFVPYVISADYISWDGFSMYDAPRTMLDVYNDTCQLVPWVWVLLIAVTLAAFACKLFPQLPNFGKIGMSTAFLQCILSITYIFLLAGATYISNYGANYYEPGFLYYVLMLCTAIVAILAIVVNRLDAMNKPAIPVQEPQQQTPNFADELLEYKRLLDAGAITQEEYEEKKRQLLDR